MGTLAVGESGLQLLRFGSLEARLTGALRTDGILRGLGGLFGGSFTTAQRDAIASGKRPYGLIILNTTTNQYEWNKGSDTTPNWQPLAPVAAAGPWNTTDIVDGAITSAKIANGAILDADVAAAAGIIYSKLNLAGSITNADLAGAIAYSKLVLSGNIVNADLSPAAAIAISKLAGYPNDVTKWLRGDASWAALPVATPTLQSPGQAPQTASRTAVMMGLGSQCHFTPTKSGIVAVIWSTIYWADGSFAGLSTCRIRYGTGAAPVWNAAATGTAIGPDAPSPSLFLAVASGLTVGTTYWFDMGLASNNNAPQNVAGLQASTVLFIEL